MINHQGGAKVAQKGLSMREIEEMKRLRDLGFSNRKIGKSLGYHRNTVNKYLEDLDSKDNTNCLQDKVQQKLSPPQVESAKNLFAPAWTKSVDWKKVEEEYLKGVSLQVIHEELVLEKRVPVLYPGFWKQLQKRINLSRVTMIRIFKPGERSEIDYCDGINILDPVTGEIKTTELFVGVLCQSRYTFAEFTWSQKSEDFLSSHVNMFNFFGGCSQVISPDNLKSAITKSHRYDPVVNPAYSKLAEHYGVAVVPARVKTPQDKAIVERTIQIFQRWFYSKVRMKTFTSLFELNKSLKEHLEIFNQKKHRIFMRSRLEMFLEEKKFLLQLPETAFEVASYRKSVLGRDCHLILHKNFYSAPHRFRGKELDVWFTNKKVEIYFEAERVALHRRDMGEGKFLTDPAHYPESHRAYFEEDIQTLLIKAKQIGPQTEKLLEVLLKGPAPYRHFRRSQGIIALSWKYSKSLLEEASEVALRFNRITVQYVEGVMRMRKGVQKTDEDRIQRSENPNLRGVNTIHVS